MHSKKVNYLKVNSHPNCMLTFSGFNVNFILKINCKQKFLIMKRKKTTAYLKKQSDAQQSFKDLLQKKFGENFTFVITNPKGHVSGHGWVTNFLIEAQVFVAPPGQVKADVIYFSVVSNQKDSKKMKEAAAKGLVIKLRQMNIAV